MNWTNWEKLKKTAKVPFAYNWNLSLSGFTCQNLLFNIDINLIIFVTENSHLYLSFWSYEMQAVFSVFPFNILSNSLKIIFAD